MRDDYHFHIISHYYRVDVFYFAFVVKRGWIYQEQKWAIYRKADGYVSSE